MKYGLILCGLIFLLMIIPSDLSATEEPPKRILILGDSITAGYGIDPSLAFPALIQARIDSLGWAYEVVSAGVSGDTSAGGLRRLNWVLKQPVDVFVLELGANDGLRGLPLNMTRHNLQAILDEVTKRFPQAKMVIAGMEVPTNLGEEYTAEFRQIFPALAQENKATLIPFLLEAVAAIPELNQADGIHPTAEGHILVAETMWKYLEPVLIEDQNIDKATDEK